MKLIPSFSPALPAGDDFDGWHDAPHLPIMTMQEYDDSASYAEGTQKKVSGEVVRWHHKTGPVRVPAEQHIQALENEVKVLKQQVSGLPKRCSH